MSEDSRRGSTGQDVAPRHPSEAADFRKGTDGVFSELLVDHDVLRCACPSQCPVSVLGESVELDDDPLFGEPEVDAGDEATDDSELVLQDRRWESDILGDEVGQALTRRFIAPVRDLDQSPRPSNAPPVRAAGQSDEQQLPRGATPEYRVEHDDGVSAVRTERDVDGGLDEIGRLDPVDRDGAHVTPPSRHLVTEPQPLRSVSSGVGEQDTLGQRPEPRESVHDHS